MLAFIGPGLEMATTMNMQPYHILVVDNDPSAANVTLHGLSRALGNEVEVTLAASVAEAWVECQHQQVGLLIVDPVPGNVGASGLLEMVRRECPQVEVLVLTSYDTPRTRRTMREIGVTHYLAKPVDLPTLTAEVQSLLKAPLHRRHQLATGG